MNFSRISKMQRELDEEIWRMHQENAASTTKKRMLAFLVELGELANETRCFKFWSNKASSSFEVVLDEYVDGIHFLISLGNDLAIDFSKQIYQDSRATTWPLYQQFMEVYSKATALSEHFDSVHYQQLFDAYMNLGYALGYTFEDVERGYDSKNAVNHERQANNY